MAADANAKVMVQGENLKEGLQLQLDEETTVSLLQDENGGFYFIMPSGLNSGALSVKLVGSEDVLSTSFYGLTEDSDYPLFSGDPAMICSDKKFYNADGVLTDGTKDCSGDVPPECSKDGETDCVANQDFAAAKTLALAAKVKTGETVAGIPGNYVPDFPDAANVRTVDSVNGSPGTLADCADNGLTGCVTTATYQSANLTDLSAWNLRYGVTVGSVTGKLKMNCRNIVDTGTYDNITAPAIGGVDIWDNIDDNNDYGTFPTTNPWDGDEYFCGFTGPDDPTWEQVETTPVTSGQYSIFVDKITDQMWTRGDGIIEYYWQNAVTYCNELDHGGYDDWRLPTQKELMSAYVRGIYSLHRWNIGPDNLDTLDTFFWSATSDSNNIGYAWAVNLSSGSTYSGGKSVTSRVVVCVR